jgi:hypothetical protein
MSDKMAYLARAFTRVCAEAIQFAQKQRQRTMSEAAKHGFGGRVLLLIAEEYERAAANAADRMVRLAYSVTGSTEPPVCDAVERGLVELRDRCTSDLRGFLETQTSLAPPNARKEVTERFLTAMGVVISASLDDMRHGIAGGTRLTKDPVVSVISNITNSPGAVQQSGVGNVQQTVTSGTTNNIQSALAQFMNSTDVQGLTAENKQSVADVAEVLASELKKPQPDASKIARWGRRLIDIAERLGIGVVASGLSHTLFG